MLICTTLDFIQLFVNSPIFYLAPFIYKTHYTHSGPNKKPLLLNLKNGALSDERQNFSRTLAFLFCFCDFENPFFVF